MPRKRISEPVSVVGDNIPVTVPEKKPHNRRVKVLAKMLLREVRGPKEDKIPQQSASANLISGSSAAPPQQIADSQQGMATVAKVKKPRKPPTPKMLDWQKTFAEVRKRYPGRRTPEFDDALRKASVVYKQRWANRKD